MSRLALAAVAGAHGVRGEVRLKLFAESAASLGQHQSVFVDGMQRRLIEVRDGGKVAVARIEGIGSREAAEALRGTLVEVEREALPPLPDGEYYHADLIGLPCVDAGGQALGTVVSVENYGAGDLLEVTVEGGRTSLIPIRPGIADLEPNRVVIDPEFLA